MSTHANSMRQAVADHCYLEWDFIRPERLCVCGRDLSRDGDPALSFCPAVDRIWVHLNHLTAGSCGSLHDHGDGEVVWNALQTTCSSTTTA